jgi:hypothetical protein
VKTERGCSYTNTVEKRCKFAQDLIAERDRAIAVMQDHGWRVEGGLEDAVRQVVQVAIAEAANSQKAVALLAESKSALDAALKQVAALRESYYRIGVGGNHLASALIGLLGAGSNTFPPYWTEFKEASEIISDPIKYDLWVAWAVIMRERDALERWNENPSRL